MNRIGDLIKLHRKMVGWSQVQLAKNSGVSQVTISQYENGKRSPQFEQVSKIADAFGISLDELIGLYNPMEYEEIQKNKFASLSSDYLDNLTVAFGKLNKEGQKKAVERIEELTEIPKYQRQDSTEDHSEDQ